MGMDISGINPIVKSGEYFRANCWSWRPLHFLCMFADEQFKLNIDFTYWDYNDGAGLKTEGECLKLADALEAVLQVMDDLKDDEDELCVCLGSWIDVETRQFINTDGRNKVNKDYPKGMILYSSVIDGHGRLVKSAHSITLGHIKEFILFLRTSGGFEIW
jgi:hypothetical protein